jgi:hypothetical protein
MGFEHVLQGIETRVDRWDYGSLRWNYAYGKRLDGMDASSLKARVHALGISLVCAGTFVTKLCCDLARLTVVVLRSLCSRRLETGNIQLAVVYVAEMLRSAAGMVFGSAIGVCSPQLARRLFLVRDAGQLRRVLDVEAATRLYALTAMLKDVMEANDLDYRAISGSFLGALRHRGLIPWDDDVDVMLSPEATEKMKQWFKEPVVDKHTGICIAPASETAGWRLFFAEGDKAADFLGGASFPFVDVFGSQYSEDGQRIEYASKLMYAMAPQEYFTLDEWHDMTYYRFGPLSLPGSAKTDALFRRCWGDGARDFAYLLYHHDDLKVKQWPQRVFIEERSGALYDQKLFLELRGKIQRQVA